MSALSSTWQFGDDGALTSDEHRSPDLVDNEWGAMHDCSEEDVLERRAGHVSR